MKRPAVVFFIVLITAAAGSLTASDRLAAGDQARSGKNASRVQIVQAPTLESATDTAAIVRWTTNSVEGTTVRYGVVHFGVDPRQLSQVAKSQNRWNRELPWMIYRVQLDNLEPGFTYYYAVETTTANGVSEGGMSSELYQFTTQRQH
jgi:hypothetical protein